MQFNEYLKKCRDKNELTQEQLVSKLYNHDIEKFGALDTRALSKWERGVTTPPASKQVSIINYFQHITGLALPCWTNYTAQETEKLICTAGMNNLIGKSKKHIFDFPSDMMRVDDMNVSALRNFDNMDTLIANNMHLHQTLNHASSQLSAEQFKAWAMHPSNFFLACEHKGAFLGLLFVTRVKPEVFNKIMHFKMKKSDVCIEDFASFDEVGSNLLLSFFALNKKAANLLFIRYYAHLIAHQTLIDNIGGLAHLDEAKNLVSNMNLQYQDSQVTDDAKVTSYAQSLANILASEYAVKMLLSKQECPVE